MNIDKFTITSWDQMVGWDRVDGNLELIMDELTDFTLAQEEERVDLTGKSGRRIGSLKRNKAVTGSGTNGMLSGGTLAAMTGAEIEDGEHEVQYTDAVVVNSNEGTTTEKAIGAVGNEIGTVYVRDEQQAYIAGGKKLTQTSGEPESGRFSYDPESKKLKFYADEVPDGTEVIVIYTVKQKGKKISNNADKYSKTLKVVIDVTCQDVCDNIFHGQFRCDRADFNGTFDITGGSDPSTQSFEFTSLPNLCTGKSDLWDFIVFD